MSHAAPAPKTLYQPSKLPLIPETTPTQQKAFQLQSEARHQQVLQARHVSCHVSGHDIYGCVQDSLARVPNAPTVMHPASILDIRSFEDPYHS